MINLKNVDYNSLFKILTRVLAIIILAIICIVIFGAPVQSDKLSSYDMLMERGILKVGVCSDVPILGVLEDDKVVGLEPKIANKLNQAIFGEDTAPMIVPYNDQTKEYALSNGDVDLLMCRSDSSMFSSEDYVMSQSYYVDTVSFIAAKGKDKTVDDLNGKKVACIYKSEAQDAFVNEANERGMTVEVLEYASYPEAMEALKSDKVDAFVEDSLILNKYVESGYSLSKDTFASMELVIVANASDSALIGKVDEIISAMKESGELSELITDSGAVEVSPSSE